MATLTLHDIDPALKADAMAVMKRHGLTASHIISAFLRKIVSDHESGSRCFCCDLEPSQETIKDLEDAKAGKVKYTACKDTNDLFSKLGI
jgi:antitoxin component of RelBE/YafQ-DinJ toxin-antitoxin module